MFSQYVDGRFAPLDEPSHQTISAPQSAKKAPNPSKSNNLMSELTSGISQLIGGIGKQFSLSRLDTGDILLALIILFLFLEGDNLELVITLGLMLLLGFQDDQSTS